jgi:hypothetical protein
MAHDSPEWVTHRVSQRSQLCSMSVLDEPGPTWSAVFWNRRIQRQLKLFRASSSEKVHQTRTSACVGLRINSVVLL